MGAARRRLEFKHGARTISAGRVLIALQMVELKSGETYSGMLTGCDGFMNLKLRDSVRTSRVRTASEGALRWRAAPRASLATQGNALPMRVSCRTAPPSGRSPSAS